MGRDERVKSFQFIFLPEPSRAQVEDSTYSVTSSPTERVTRGIVVVIL